MSILEIPGNPLNFDFSEYLNIHSQQGICPGFSWDRVNCLLSSWYSAMFWVLYAKNVDNTDVFSCCWVVFSLKSRIFQLLMPSQQESWRGTRSWHRTQPGQLTQTGQRGIPYRVTAFDTVSHGILLEKLAAHGLDKCTLRWVKNWLDGQAQRVVVNGFTSSWWCVTSDVRCNCSPLADQCPVSSRAAIYPQANSPQFIYWAWHHMVWNIPLAGLGQLCWLCPLKTSCAPPAFLLAGRGKLKNPWLGINTT